ncbi:hypothetical protein ACMA1I_13170 [Pontibacter sp. 13R65]|uniref:hypothetical protein n=1 Tax=Pontibacter sp. 13R65 TaxID=3127458 RepID=UPI00301DC0AC
MKKRKVRLLYTPGLLSLILILPLCLYYFNRQEILKEKSVIEINSLSPEFANEIVNDTSSYYFGLDPNRPFPIRNYKKYVITGQEQQDLEAFKQAHLDVKRLQIANDTINGVFFYFAENAKYWTFVKALDIVKGEKIKCYLHLKNEIWVYNIPEPRSEEIPQMICGNSILFDNEVNGGLIKSLDVDLLIYKLGDLWIVYVIFLFITYLNIKKVKKYYDQRQFV